MRRSLAAVLFCVIALAMPALFAQAGGWFSPGARNGDLLSHTIYGSGGPMDGMWEDALSGDYSMSCFHEDFDDAFMPDVNGTMVDNGLPGESWASSGWTIGAAGTDLAADPNLVVRQLGGSVFILSLGGQGTGDIVHVSHNGLGRIIAIDPDGGGAGTAAGVLDFGHRYKIRQMMLAFGKGYYTNLRNTFVARISTPQDSEENWNSAWAIGYTMEDAALMVPTTGALETAWTTDGILFHMSQAGVLSVNVSDGTTITKRTLDVSAGLNATPKTYGFQLGFVFDQGATAGTGTLQAYYKQYSPSENSTSHTLPWLPLGAALTGDIFPDLDPQATATADYIPAYRFHAEVNNHNTADRDPTMYIEWIGACDRKESFHSS